MPGGVKKENTGVKVIVIVFLSSDLIWSVHLSGCGRSGRSMISRTLKPTVVSFLISRSSISMLLSFENLFWPSLFRKSASACFFILPMLLRICFVVISSSSCFFHSRLDSIANRHGPSITAASIVSLESANSSLMSRMWKLSSAAKDRSPL